MIIHNGDNAQYEIDNAGVPPEQRSDWPLPSFDAQDWAKEFCRIAKKNGQEIDESWMITWFANALMRGYDEGRSASAKSRKAVKETPERVWMWFDGYHTPQIATRKPPDHIKSVEYIRLQTDWNSFGPTEHPEIKHDRTKNPERWS